MTLPGLAAGEVISTVGSVQRGVDQSSTNDEGYQNRFIPEEMASMREKLCCLGLIYESILGITILSRTRNALILPLINTNMLESLYIQCLQ